MKKLSWFLLGILISFAVFGSPLLSFAATADQDYGDISVSSIVTLTNIDRAKIGINPLTKNEKLQKAAQMKAEDMATKDYFAHITPDNKTPWYWLEKTGYDFTAAGENLAMNYFTSTDIENAWMNSASHKKNILNNEYVDIGIGLARGMHDGIPTTYVVQMFGVEDIKG